jgi:hypothetical protein
MPELPWHARLADRRTAWRLHRARPGACTTWGAEYPVRDGIGLFLLPDLPREDLWQNIDSALIGQLRDNPDVEQRLMGGPLESLKPANSCHGRALPTPAGRVFEGAAIDRFPVAETDLE